MYVYCGNICCIVCIKGMKYLKIFGLKVKLKYKIEIKNFSLVESYNI